MNSTLQMVEIYPFTRHLFLFFYLGFTVNQSYAKRNQARMNGKVSEKNHLTNR